MRKILVALILCALGLFLMAASGIIIVRDAIAMNDDRITILAQLGEMLHRTGYGAWVAMFLYFFPLYLGLFLVIISSRAIRRLKNIRR